MSSSWGRRSFICAASGGLLRTPWERGDALRRKFFEMKLPHGVVGLNDPSTLGEEAELATHRLAWNA